MRKSFDFASTSAPLVASLSVTASLYLGASQLYAGIVPVAITPTASGPGLDTMSYNNTTNAAPGNDAVAGASTNILAINQKAFNAVDYIDIFFTVEDSAGTTEYLLTEGVHNGTGVTWTDFHLVLGFGTGTSFVQSGPGDGLDFDAPDLNSPASFAPFTTVTVLEDTIDVSGGSVLDGQFVNYGFTVDVPDGITYFTIRQLPTIDSILPAGAPEPSTITLAVLCLLSLGMTRRRRRR